jgi:predicted metal-dependent HD superfamily phosphohydrolase
VNQAGSHPCFRSHGRNRRPALAVLAEHPDEGSRHFTTTLGSNSRAAHMLVVSPIYPSHASGMDALRDRIRTRLVSGGLDTPASLLDRVSCRYAEPHRHYHTLTHIAACLDARAQITDSALPEVDLALLFHDAIYDPLASDNEGRSACLLVEEGRRAWLHEQRLQRARVLVLATRHGEEDVVHSEEACIVVDADLSILGSDREAFEEYERLVRREYAFVDDAAYRAGRLGVLQAFLERPSIYATGRGRQLWEARARRNLEASVASLLRISV